MKAAFAALYGAPDGMRVFRAPGRVNLIGEHTDYNLGFVMPMALSLATYIARAPNHDGRLRIYSEHTREMREWPVAALGQLTRQRHWTDYPVGVARQLLDAGLAIAPANLLIRSTVPDGSGLSSSAALEVATALALLNGRDIPPLDLARLCQRAEREFVGMPCGIMDQFVSVFGREHSAIMIDCRSLEHRAAHLPDGVSFVAVNTMVKHALAASAYRERTEECAAAARGLGAASLRDVSPEQLEREQSRLTPVVMRRARHIVTENARVQQFTAASAQGDLQLMGRLLVDSHRSLRDDYAVSCAELDFLVDTALGVEGVLGARMTGGGFGGCTVTMLRSGVEGRFHREVTSAYRARFGVEPAVYPCQASDGAGEVKDLENLPAAG